MKNFKTTLVFAIFVIGVGAFAYWEYQNSQKETEAKAKEGLVFNLERDQVNLIDFKSADKALRLEKIDGTWQMLAPIEDKASDAAIDQWLMSLLDQKAKNLSEQLPDKNLDWTKYYITDTSQTLTVGPVKLVFGDSNAYDGSYYIRKGDELLLGDVSWAQALNRSPKDLRNKDLYEPAGEVMSIEISPSGKKTFKLEHKDSSWTLIGNTSLKISSARVNEFLETLKTLNANDIVEDELSASTLSKYNLRRPSVEIKIAEEGSGKPYILTLGEISASKNEVYLYTSKRETVYAIEKNSAEKLRATIDFFRDGSEPFSVDWAKVDKAVVKDGDQTTVIEKSEIESFSSQFKKLEARVFLPRSAGKSLGAQTIELFQGTDSLLKLETGADFTSDDVPSSMNPLRYVKSSQFPEILGVRATVIQGIMRELPAQSKKGENKEKPVLGQ